MAIWLGGVLSLFILYGLIFLNWLTNLKIDTSQTSPQPVKIQPAQNGPQSGPELSQVASLFGEPKPTEPVAPPVAKESSLPLKLAASFTADGMGRSAAILDSGGGKQRLYFQGAEIMPGIELVEVQTRRVLIKRNGTLEYLALAHSSSLFEANSTNSEGNPAEKPKAAGNIVDGSGALIEKLEKLRAARTVKN